MSGTRSSTDFSADDFGAFEHEDLTAFARDQRLGDLRGAEDEIDRAGCDRAARHAVIVGFAHVLGDDEAAVRLHRFQAEAAVGAGPGRTTQMARAPYTRASELRRKSNGSRAPWRACGFDIRNAPLSSTEG